MSAVDRPGPRLARAAFFLYAAALLVATHWPRLQVPGAQAQSDKLAHLAAYFIWTLLAVAAGFFGPALSQRNVRYAALLALGYSLADECSQLIPVFGRQFSLLDAAANAGGVAAAYALARTAARTRSDTTDR